jgi:hypothetical protein
MSKSLTAAGPDLSLRSLRIVLIITFLLGMSAVCFVVVMSWLDPWWGKAHTTLQAELIVLGVNLSVGSTGGLIGSVFGGRKVIDYVFIAIALMWFSFIIYAFWPWFSYMIWQFWH